MWQTVERAAAIAAVGLMVMNIPDPLKTSDAGGFGRGTTGTLWRKWCVGSTLAVCAILAGCASATDVKSASPGVKSANQQGTLTVSGAATGGRLAWARAHESAHQKATDYCERRGMQASFADEQTGGGIEALQQQETVVHFHCDPKF